MTIRQYFNGILLLSLICLTAFFSCTEDGGSDKKKFEPKFDDKPTIYKVRVKTGCDSLAGTAAKIKIVLKGEKGDSDELDFARPDGGPITPCETTILEFPSKRDLGKISELEVWHDDSNEDPSWLPEIISVVNIKNNVRWDFPCGKWLDSKQFDQRTRRTFYLNRECN